MQKKISLVFIALIISNRLAYLRNKTSFKVCGYAGNLRGDRNPTPIHTRESDWQTDPNLQFFVETMELKCREKI